MDAQRTRGQRSGVPRRNNLPVFSSAARAGAAPRDRDRHAASKGITLCRMEKVGVQQLIARSFAKNGRDIVQPC